MSSPELAVIGGSGFYRWQELESATEHEARTPFGPPAAPVVVGQWLGQRIAFLARHGREHHLLPHQVNYRANIHALWQTGVKTLLAVNAVGTMHRDLVPGSLVLPDQLIDYTWGRDGTYAGVLDDVPNHLEFAEPFDHSFRSALWESDRPRGHIRARKATVGVTQGPRLETAAEVGRMRGDGCDLVGMTSMPEAALAKELGIRYVSLAVVANWAAGIEKALEIDQIMAQIHESMDSVRAVVGGYIEAVLSQ